MNATNIRLHNKIKDMPIAEALSYIKIMAENKSEKVVSSFLIDCVILASDRRLMRRMLEVRTEASTFCKVRFTFDLGGSNLSYAVAFDMEAGLLEVIDAEMSAIWLDDEEQNDQRTFNQKLCYCVNMMIKAAADNLNRDSILSAGLFINFAMEFGNSKRMRQYAEYAILLAEQ